jgi:catechol 2,3-dioxygenase-like lactoylglutathione lyase family enzyme
MLAAARTHPTLPVADLARARRFYEDVLGLAAARVTPAGVFYATGEGTQVFVFPSAGRPSGAHTQVGFRVPDIEAEVADLKARGVVFETYDFAGFDPSTSIATFAGNRSAWFRDTEGNLLGVVQMLEPA